MRVQLDIEFEQLVQVAKELPAHKWNKLKKVVEKSKANYPKDTNMMEALLLNAPTFSKKQLLELKKTRALINQWRKK